jgi:pyruvate/2-oxoacid:ferredoxin oxidoreductase beta subunit|tara:strand:- start:186 stop:677 length:492 start_codon:yes stop_codon:yes gene_type:complete
MKNVHRLLSIAAATAVLGTGYALAHCQIPCGIYGDEARFAAIEEDLRTIEKSMTKIEELSTDPTKNQNQIARWVQNKEKHADHIADIVTSYFLQQRIKPANGAEKEAYLNKLSFLHQMLVHSMKAKQTTEVSHVRKLRGLLTEFHDAYLHKPATGKKEGSSKK